MPLQACRSQALNRPPDYRLPAGPQDALGPAHHTSIRSSILEQLTINALLSFNEIAARRHMPIRQRKIAGLRAAAHCKQGRSAAFHTATFAAACAKRHAMCVSECEIAATSIHPTAFSRRCRYTIAMQITRSKMQVSSVPHVRWVVLLLAIMLHALAIEWAGGHIGLPAMHSPSQTALIAQLHAAQTLHAARVATPNAAAAPKPDRPKPAAKRAPSSRRKRTSNSAEPPQSQPAPAAAQTPELETAMQSADHSVPPDGTPLPAVSSQADMPQQVALAALALSFGVFCVVVLFFA